MIDLSKIQRLKMGFAELGLEQRSVFIEKVMEGNGKAKQFVHNDLAVLWVEMSDGEKLYFTQWALEDFGENMLKLLEESEEEE